MPHEQQKPRKDPQPRARAMHDIVVGRRRTGSIIMRFCVVTIGVATMRFGVFAVVGVMRVMALVRRAHFESSRC